MDYLLGFVNDVGEKVASRRRAHSAHGETRNGERRLGVGARRSSPRVLFSGNANPGGCNEGELKGNVARNVVWPRRRTHYALGLALGMERRLGDWRKAQFAQGVIPGELLRGGIGEGNGEERSAASGYVVGRRTGETALQR